MTLDCTITLPEPLAGKEQRITDGLVESYQAFEPSQTVQVGLPEGAQGLYLEWYDFTSLYTVSQLTQTARRYRKNPPSRLSTHIIRLQRALRASSFRCPAKPRSPRWRSTARRAARHRTALGTGGRQRPARGRVHAIYRAGRVFRVISLYGANHDIPTALVVMSRYSRSAQQELLSALWYAGYDTYPISQILTSVTTACTTWSATTGPEGRRWII